MKNFRTINKIVKEEFKKIFYSESHSDKPAHIKVKEPFKSVFSKVSKTNQKKNDLRGC